MKCELCEDFEGPRKSVAAHICGRHDDTHSEYVGLDDNDEPLLRRDHERQKRAEEQLKNVATADTAEATPDADNDSSLAPLLGLGAAGLLARELTDDTDERDTI
jgi:hypothetical protein